jgi:hypothetical protein
MTEAYEKISETCLPRGEFKLRYWFFADAPSPNIGRNCTVALFEKIYYEVPILTVFSNIGEDVQYRFRPHTGWGLHRFL